MICWDLVRKLERSPPVNSNEPFNIATSFASGEEAVGAIFDGKKGKRVDDAPVDGSRSTSGARKARSRATRRARRGATTTATRPSLLTRLEGALEQPLEAPVYSTTC
jgi:hypothetical protein